MIQGRARQRPWFVRKSQKPRITASVKAVERLLQAGSAGAKAKATEAAAREASSYAETERIKAAREWGRIARENSKNSAYAIRVLAALKRRADAWVFRELLLDPKTPYDVKHAAAIALKKVGTKTQVSYIIRELKQKQLDEATEAKIFYPAAERSRKKEHQDPWGKVALGQMPKIRVRKIEGKKEVVRVPNQFTTWRSLLDILEKWNPKAKASK
ncbi:MAG TPA: hypothetical protein HA222_01670 [Candidatus Diapherotrites archaeon]|uniref:Uncharacterized protein n=1 Tax=Candidatus Iainarchaeum sp. TaxID=3101447 RepID=A0A7J4JV58_9ARCH|nr:hypothetical protein [Candidatus Diapherotrites archaeon]